MSDPPIAQASAGATECPSCNEPAELTECEYCELACCDDCRADVCAAHGNYADFVSIPEVP